MITSDRRAEIIRCVEQKRAMHPEFRSRLTKAGLKAALAREGVRIRVRRHGRLAQLVPLPAGWTIIIEAQTTDSERLMLAAHELAHLYLHHDPFFARHETEVYDVSPPWYDAVREEEADVFAELLVRGPDVGIIKPAKSDLPARKRSAPGIIRPRRAKQLELVDPDDEAFLAMARCATRDPLPAPDPTALVQLVIPRRAWSVVNLEHVRRRAGHSAYRDDTIAMPHCELVTCTENVALAIVEDLARAGHKRTAVTIRRTIRETRRAREQGS